MAKTRLVVGIPEEKTKRNDKMNNATLGYIHEFGSPANNIPARAWLVPGVKASQPKWTKLMEKAGQFAFEGELPKFDAAMNSAGTVAVSSVKTHITAGIPPPLAPLTRARRQAKRKKTKTGPSPLPSMFGGMTPLVDTAQMLNSVTYVLRKTK
jgi:hypothetical protein